MRPSSRAARLCGCVAGATLLALIGTGCSGGTSGTVKVGASGTVPDNSTSTPDNSTVPTGPTTTVSNANIAQSARISSRLVLGQPTQWLDPPLATDTPAISTDAALRPTDGAGNVVTRDFGSVQPIFRLGRFTNAVTGDVDPKTHAVNHWFTNRLVWAVIYNGVPHDALGFQGGDFHNVTTIAPPPFGSYVLIVDAMTGADLQEIAISQTYSAAQLG